MDIFKNEICKLLNKRTILILVLLIVLNSLLQLYNINTINENGYSQKEYSDVYREISKYNREDVIGIIEEYKNNAVTYGKRNLYDKVYTEVDACLNYGEYLEAVDKKAEDIAIMNKYMNNSDYSLKNAEKTNKVYQKLKGVEPKVDDPTGVINITNNEITNYIAIIILFVFALRLVFDDKKDNQFSFLRTTSNGRRKLMFSKTLVMMSAALITAILLYGINTVISVSCFGNIDLNSPIQGIYLYHNSPFDWSIGAFLVIYFLVKITSFVLLGILFMMICAIFDQIVFVFAVAALVVISEVICFVKISGIHYLAILKYCNLMFGVNTSGLFADYVNINLFGQPVNVVILYGVFWAILIAIALMMVIRYLDKPFKKNTLIALRFDWFTNRGNHTSLSRHELYKMFISARGLVVLIASCVFALVWNPIESIQFDRISEVYYKEYMDQLYGPLDTHSYEQFNEEKEKYDQLYENITADLLQGKSENYISVKYKDEFDKQEAFQMLVEKVDYLETKESGWLFYEKGYEILTDENEYKNRDVSQAFVYIIVLVALVYGVYGIDYENSEMRILRTTYWGRRKLKFTKEILGILGTVIAFLLIYVFRLVRVLEAYGIKGINAPAASMEHLSRIPSNISVLEYMILIMLMRFIAGLIITKTIFVACQRFKNSIMVVIICILLFLIPLVLVALGMPNAKYLLLNPLLLGNVF